MPPPALQRGKDANDLLASLFTWAAGRRVTAPEVERCFPLVPHGKVLMPYVLWDRITELGEWPEYSAGVAGGGGARCGTGGRPVRCHALPSC